MNVVDLPGQLTIFQASSHPHLPAVVLAQISSIIESRLSPDASINSAHSSAQLAGDGEMKVTTVRKRDLDLIQNQPIFLLSLTIHVGAGRLSLRFEELGLSDRVVDVLKKAHASAPSITVFPELQVHGRTLQYRRKCLQDKFMVRFDPFWVVHSTDLPDVYSEIKAMSADIDSLRSQILHGYAPAYARFLETVAVLATNAGLDQPGVTAALEAYSSRFPTPEQVERGFRLELFGPVAIPSLVEQAKENADLAAALARSEEVEALRVLQTRWRHQIEQNLDQALSSARDEVCSLVAETLSQIENHQLGSQITPSARERLQRTFERLQTLLNFDGSFSELVTEVSQIHSLFVSSGNGQSSALSHRLHHLRLQLRGEVAQIQTEGSGHRSLAEWIEM